MKRNILIAAVVIGAAFGIGFLVADRDDGVELVSTPTPAAEDAWTPAPPISEAPIAPRRTPAMHTVRFTASGPVPRELRIAVGDLVTFISDVAGFWPASDPHPLHTLCPGFDARRALGIGETYEVPFPVARTCTYHDHVNPADSSRRGTVIVQ